VIAPAAGRSAVRTVRLRTVVWTVATVAVLAGLAWRVDWSSFAQALADVSVGVLGLALLANVASVVLKAMTWQGLVDGLPGAAGRSRGYDLVGATLCGALLNLMLVARLGEVGKVVLGRRRLSRRGVDVGHEALAGTVLAEHVIATLALSALVGAVALAVPLPGYALVAVLGIGAACLAAAAVATAVLPRPLRPPRRGPLRPLRGRVGAGLHDAWNGLHRSHRGLRRPRRLAFVAATAAGQWVAQWAAIMLGLVAVGLGDVGIGGATAVLVALTLAHALPLTPGGLGVNQAAAAAPLVATYGVDPGAAIAAALVIQMTESVVTVGGGLASAVGEVGSVRRLRRLAVEPSG
jgi:hypothetical protein